MVLGEKFTANDLAASVSFARKLVPWFSFGVSGKLIHSNIWRCNANAVAMDLGVIVNTHFFSVTGEQKGWNDHWNEYLELWYPDEIRWN